MNGFKTEVNDQGVATLTLARPEKHNAFDEDLVKALHEQLVAWNNDDNVRLLSLEAEGKSFSSGGDLTWMQRMVDASEEDNHIDAMSLSLLFNTLYCFSKPTIALVQGPCYGGGVGLVACCDVAIASTAATFCFSETRLGLVPATIAPFVLKAIGARQARRWFLTAENFNADTAYEIGLVHEVVVPDELSTRKNTLCEAIRQNGPHALAACKALISTIADEPIDDFLLADTAKCIAKARVGEEAQERLTTFLERHHK